MPKIEKEKIYLRVFENDTALERMLLINELGEDIPNPFITLRLNKTQIGTLAGYMELLPFDIFRVFGLHYCLHYTDKKITKKTGIVNVKGTLAYYKDRLTQCMGLPRPIAERYWKSACDKCLMEMYG